MLNRIELIGHLGHDPKFYPENGNKKAYAVVTIATSDKYAGQEVTEWNNLMFFGKAAETIHRYTQKGSLLYVAGKLQTRKFVDRQGNNRESKTIVVNDFQILRDNQREQQPRNNNRQQYSRQQQTQQRNDDANRYDDPFGEGDNMPF